jgi:hypothetical protein
MNDSTPATSNQRRTRRRRPKGSTKFACHTGPFGLGPNVAVQVLDVSEAGVRLVVQAALRPGQEIQVSLEGVARSRPVKAVARVVWAVEAADGNYCVGAQFERTLSYADLQHLTGP